jgi:hypothetical protein
MQSEAASKLAESQSHKKTTASGPGTNACHMTRVYDWNASREAARRELSRVGFPEWKKNKQREKTRRDQTVPTFP